MYDMNTVRLLNLVFCCIVYCFKNITPEYIIKKEIVENSKHMMISHNAENVSSM